MSRGTNHRPFIAGVKAGLLHALLMAAAFPPLHLPPLALVAAVPLMLLTYRTTRPWRSALGAALGSLPFWALTHWWIADITDAGLPVLLLYLCLYPGLYVWLGTHLPLSRLGPAARPLALAALWTALEFLRAEIVWHGYPWYLIAHPLAGCLVSIVAASLGQYAVSFLVAWINAGVCRVLATPRTERRFGRGFLIRMFLVLVAAAPRISAPWSESLGPIAVVQTNIPQSNKDSPDLDTRLSDFSTMLRLTSEAAHAPEKPALIVWPETMFPGNSLSPDVVAEERRSGLGYPSHRFALTEWHDQLMDVQRSLGVPMLIGSMGIDGFRIVTDDSGPRIEYDARYNSAYVLDQGTVLSPRYDKAHLTPFGEVMPYISAWPWLERNLLALGAQGMTFDLKAGDARRALDVPYEGGTLTVAVPICFESTMPTVVRSLVRNSTSTGGSGVPASLIINITNDGWLSGSVAARRNFVLNCRWRCIELGVPMVRAANTGISCVIDARGRVVVEGPNLGEPKPDADALVEGVLSARVPYDGGPGSTLYSRIGDWFGPAVFIVGLGLAGLSILNARSGGRTSPPALA